MSDIKKRANMGPRPEGKRITPDEAYEVWLKCRSLRETGKHFAEAKPSRKYTPSGIFRVLMRHPKYRRKYLCKLESQVKKFSSKLKAKKEGG